MHHIKRASSVPSTQCTHGIRRPGKGRGRGAPLSMAPPCRLRQRKIPWIRCASQPPHGVRPGSGSRFAVGRDVAASRWTCLVSITHVIEKQCAPHSRRIKKKRTSEGYVVIDAMKPYISVLASAADILRVAPFVDDGISGHAVTLWQLQPLATVPGSPPSCRTRRRPRRRGCPDPGPARRQGWSAGRTPSAPRRAGRTTR